MALGSSVVQTYLCTGKGYGDHQSRHPCQCGHHQQRTDPKARRLTCWTQTGVSCCLRTAILCGLQVQAASQWVAAAGSACLPVAEVLLILIPQPQHNSSQHLSALKGNACRLM